MSAPVQVQPPVAEKPAAPVPTTQPNNKAVADSPEDHKNQKLRKRTDIDSPIFKYAWLAGHVITLVFTLIYAFYYIQFKSQKSWVPKFAYRLGLMGVWLSYTIQILSLYDKKSIPSYSALLPTENFQMLLLSFIWFLNRSSIFKILPYYLISLLQLSNFFHIKPVLKLSKFFEKVIVYNELALFVVLIVDTLLMRGNSGFGLVAYGMFYWLRILESENTRAVLYNIVSKLDGVLSKQKNAKVVEGWNTVKTFLTAKQGRLERQFLN